MGRGMVGLLRDTRRARRQGPDAVQWRQRDRLAEIVAVARAGSPYYRHLYRDLPARVEDPTLLPVSSKQELMARFDEWSTDREVTLETCLAFVDDPGLVGQRFLGRYTLATTSGTTGTRGIFLVDARSLAVAAALAVRMMTAWLNARDVIRIVAGGGRMAMVTATGGHFASTVAAARLRRRGDRVAVIPVGTPLPEMVARLNRFRPLVLAPYASIGALLAGEQDVGRLHINPVLVVLSAEGLPLREYDRIAQALHTKVRHSYAATECPFLSYSCEHGWLHINSDWVICEPVDADGRPTSPGERSHTVLISNLANRVQPILRYDLGDSVLQRPDPCPCGNTLPAVRVQGRTADLLTFPTGDGGHVTIPPLAFDTLLDRIRHIDLFQIVQTEPATLRVRLQSAAGADPEAAWEAAQRQLIGLLTEHNLRHVTLERAEERPQQSAAGKYRPVIPLS
ncbi:phenylacetate--CoA ligase family protein [Micromonospora endolithica]|uniref:Phenylacetate--CoA ligase family protein n=1 Tax=Micromonospora endolithica TaxID=230091 RepID=A0A3A9ZQ43_9ACTN|nr:phenylacetate--CoA ligase family protein [Micromonospora endolithica]RKN50301.1 phenylacetate--CoA ligase family protein [Micromonospora endolithica]TWJ21044.1 phenylacetate-coenzyme A ligase PaaK-like adenylate-forming protein [Micromonospora endolithica]